MNLSRDQVNYIFVKQFLFPITLNAIINGGIAWLAFRELNDIPMLNGVSSIAGDTLLTCFLLPAITCLAVTLSVRKRIRNGRLLPIESLPVGMQILNQPLLVRAIIMGVFGLSLGAAALFALSKLGIHSAPVLQVIVVKMIYTGTIAGIACPVIALLAMSESAHREQID